MPTTPSTVVMPTTPSTVVMPTTPSTVVMPTTPSTVVMPTTPSTVVMPTTPSTSSSEESDTSAPVELLSPAEITPIYVKSRNRRNFSALLVEKLFDVPTRLRSNVSGRGKEKLDPEVIKYIKKKVFEFYECSNLEKKEEWKNCVKSIDEKSRALKKRKGLAQEV